MTAPDPRLEEIEGRLSKAPAKGESAFIGTALPAHATTELWNLRELARDDVAYLLAELRKAQDKLGRVEGLADEWEELAGSGSDWDRVYGKQKVSVDHTVARIRAAVADATGGERG